LAIRPREPDEPDYNESEYKDKQESARGLIRKWRSRVDAANRTYDQWRDRFKVDKLYLYYEGFQWLYETDDTNRPYVINLIFAAIETKLPNLIFNDPVFSLSPRPTGTEYNFDDAVKTTQIREDALNFVCSRGEFGLTDKHELAIMDAFFGFGVLETDYSTDRVCNPQLNSKNKKGSLDSLYCKQIPFDTFRVSANANWDLSTGKWYGYYEFVSYERLEKYKDKLHLEDKAYQDDSAEAATVDTATGKIIQVSDLNFLIPPAGTKKIWFLWDLETMKKYIISLDEIQNDDDGVLEESDFEHCPHSFLRFGKRRKGWYPLPPVWNWLSPQDEINDIANTQKVHRRRFSRKYGIKENSMEQDEKDKFLYGPDGTTFETKLNPSECIFPIADPPLDPATVQSLARSYDDFSRIAGSSSERQQVADRTTATQANLMDQAAQIRESKDSVRVGNFLEQFGRSVLRSLRKAKGPFWIKVKDRTEHVLGAMKPDFQWTQVPKQIFKGDDYDINLNISSVSPIGQSADKKSFMEFLAMLMQYPILSMSPALIREAAYRVGYKNSAVLDQFMQLAQLAEIGKMIQAKQQVAAMTAQAGGQQPGQPQPAQPGQLAQQQVAASTPPTNNEIIDAVFNRQGQVQQ
jgi:hypothetical protein